MEINYKQRFENILRELKRLINESGKSSILNKSEIQEIIDEYENK